MASNFPKRQAEDPVEVGQSLLARRQPVPLGDDGIL